MSSESEESSEYFRRRMAYTSESDEPATETTKQSETRRSHISSFSSSSKEDSEYVPEEEPSDTPEDSPAMHTRSRDKKK